MQRLETFGCFGVLGFRIWVFFGVVLGVEGLGFGLLGLLGFRVYGFRI